MKPLLFFLVYILFLQYNYSQITVVVYEFNVKSTFKTTNQWKLIFNNEKSYYFQTSQELNNDSLKTKFSNKPNTEIINIKKEYDKFYYTNFTKDTLYLQSGVLERPYYVYEKIPKINWNITNDIKTINQYTCQKATTDFRGRNYEAWFAKDIPTQAGPWKLSGLPGLILSLKDDSQTIDIQVKTIIHDPNKTIETETEFLIPKGDKISLKEFVPLKDNEIYEYIKKLNARRGITNSTSFFQKPDKRQGFEIIYEWEKEEDH